MRVTVASLVGKDLSGVVANVTAPEHRYQYSDNIGLVRRLVRAEWKKERGYRWLMLYWDREPIHTSDKIDCGYSGLRDDSEDILTWSIEVLEDKTNVCG